MKIENEEQLTECLRAAEIYLVNSAISQVKTKTFDIGKCFETECAAYKVKTLATVKRLKKSDRFEISIKYSRSIPHEH